MLLKIITPAGVLFSGETHRVQFPGEDGLTEILDNHDKMIAATCAGTIVTDVKNIDCTEGFVRVENNTVTFVCD